MAAHDPYAHLHDEGYAAAFEAGMTHHDHLVQGGGRPVTSLNGEWRLTLDLFDEGLRQKWYALDDTPPSQWAAPRDYEIEAGDLVEVPSCWNLLKPEWRYFEGAAWYTKSFDWGPGPTGERVFLQAGGANYLALVFLNGAFIGGHRGGSTPFSLEATAALRSGPNRIQIMVENRRAPNRVPMHHFDWFNYGGLYRDVALLRLRPVFIRRAQIGLVPDGAMNRVFAEVTLSDPVDGVARVAIADNIAFDVEITNGRGRAETAADVALWSPDAPILHDVAISFGMDIWRDRIGFRDVRTDGRQILLNGKDIFLKGACVHEDDLATGKTSDEADIRRRLTHARALNANFLRLAHYPHHELVGRIAER